jgi:hypothetical protein
MMLAEYWNGLQMLQHRLVRGVFGWKPSPKYAQEMWRSLSTSPSVRTLEGGT